MRKDNWYMTIALVFCLLSLAFAMSQCASSYETLQ